LKGLTKIGKVTSTHGVKGELVVVHDLTNPKEMLKWEALMLEINKDSFIPFFIEQIKIISEESVLIKFEDVAHIEDARKITNTNAYCSPLIEVKSLRKNENEALIGFIIKHNDNIIGTIKDMVDNKGQELFVLDYNGQELLIPIHQSFIKDVLPKTKTIVVDLPEGYLEAFG
jgi:16S rRNA processing protein RimM